MSETDDNPYQSPASPTSRVPMPVAPKKPKWWAGVLGGLGFIGLNYCSFLWFTDAEQGKSDPTKMPLIFIVLYHTLGRWGVLVLGSALGAFAVFVSIKQKLRQARTRQNGQSVE
jgi:hypothetical protein